MRDVTAATIRERSRVLMAQAFDVRKRRLSAKIVERKMIRKEKRRGSELLFMLAYVVGA